MTNPNDVSVVLPVFFRHVSGQQTLWLRDALQSVMDQSRSGALELIVVDDGSPEPVEKLVESIGVVSKCVSWLRLQRNVGIVGALNAGIAKAKYPLIARMDADDLWLDGKLSAQLEQFANDPNLTISATGMNRIDQAGTLIDTHIRPGDWSGILDFFVNGGCPFPHGSVVARKQVYQILGGYSHDVRVRHCEDYSLWSIWLRFFKPAMIERALYAYRVHGGSVSTVEMEQQSQASQIIRNRFAALNATQMVPAALESLSEALGASVLDAGRLAYYMWAWRAPVCIPEAALDPLATLMPDCVLTKVQTNGQDWQSALDLPGEQLPKGTIAVRAVSVS